MSTKADNLKNEIDKAIVDAKLWSSRAADAHKQIKNASAQDQLKLTREIKDYIARSKQARLQANELKKELCMVFDPQDKGIRCA